MAIEINNSFLDYFDFLDILQEILEKAPKKLFDKMVFLIINKLHKKEIELEKLSSDIDKMNSIPFDDLDEFYDNMLDTIESVNLFKKRLESIKTEEPLFDELYIQVDRVHSALVKYMDRVGQLEVKLLKEKSA